MINFNLPGASNPAAAKARSIARDFHAKQASREYDAYCAKKGIPEAEAQLLAPANVKHGKSLRMKEARKAGSAIQADFENLPAPQPVPGGDSCCC